MTYESCDDDWVFLVLGVLWGGSYVAIEIGLTEFPTLLFASLRFYITGVAILGYAIVPTDHWRPDGYEELIAVRVTGVLLIAGTHMFLYLGTPFISGAVAAIIICCPILTTVFASLLLDELLTAVGVVGFACGLVGIRLISQPDPANLLSTNVIGVGLVLVSAVCWRSASS